MRQRDPNHQKRLLEVLELEAEELLRQLEIVDYEQPDYIPSEVLASLIRARHGLATRTLDPTVSTLNSRIISGLKKQIGRNPDWQSRAQRDSEFLTDAVQRFWAELLGNDEDVCNAEVRFAVYLRDKVHDLMRNAFAQKNMNKSIEDLACDDEDGIRVDYIETVEAADGDGPEDQAIRDEESNILYKMLLALPRREQLAYYFRLELKYDWKTVAQLLNCSIPTARKLKNEAVRKLDGARS